MKSDKEPEAATGLKGITRRRSFATVDLSDAEAEAIASSRMDGRHDHLNALLDADRADEEQLNPSAIE
jgi:hypothetical protein